MNFMNHDNAVDKPLAPPQADEYETVAWGIEKCGGDFKPMKVCKPKVGEHELRVDMLFCGVCHTDVHIGLN